MLGALLGAAIALSPGAQAAQEPFCRPQPERRETRMEAYQRIRGRYGFRTDRAYIRRLIRRGVRTGGIEENFPVTRREKRYVLLRDRLEISPAASEERVTIGVVVQSFNGVQTADSARADHAIELSRPLGDCKVIDATTGKPIRPRGDSP